MGWFSVELLKFAAAKKSDQLSEFTLLLIVVGKQNQPFVRYDWPYDNDSISAICFFFLIFPVPVIFKIDYPFIVLRPSQIKFPVLHPGVREILMSPT